MSTEFNVNSDVVDLVNEIIAENGFGKETKITYAIGSQTGDGFLSRNIAVTISDDEKVLDLFLKYVSFALKDQNPELYQKLISIDEITTEDIDNQAWDDASKINIDNHRRY
ncbi:hypothetical protein QE152_g12834 [Popillia japonica]|uniref:Uncharacterized protein n=1 Tax=Popillia japonica TaxID=7064 RepID=A0AAW1LGU4_POPJA